MSSNTTLVTLMDRLDAVDRSLAALPVQGLTRREAEEILRASEHLDSRLTEVRRRLVGRLIADGAPSRLGAASWAEVLARRLHISPAEAQRRIAEAPPAA
jgi:hypothetical protein